MSDHVKVAEGPVYKVVVNQNEQYSIWPANRVNPLGWQDTGATGSKKECLEHIGRVWTDMRPLIARRGAEGSPCKRRERSDSVGR
jgi:MbtH protein